MGNNLHLAYHSTRHVAHISLDHVLYYFVEIPIVLSYVIQTLLRQKPVLKAIITSVLTRITSCLKPWKQKMD